MALKHLVSGRWHWGPDFSGYTVEVYEAGTSTQKTTYSDSDLSVANTWPVTLDANGSAQIWFDGDAKVIVKTAGGSTYQTDDEINMVGGEWCGTAGGTGDAITINPSPSISAYETGQRFVFLAAATNTGATTIAVSGLTAKNVTKNGSTALAAGDIPNGAVVTVVYDGSRFQVDRVNVVATVNTFSALQFFTAGIGPHYIQNLGFTASVATKALTIALKTKALADASSSDPVQIAFRNTTATTGDYVVRSATAATSVVVPSGATLGFTAAEDGLIYVYAIDNAGTVELAVAKKALFDESITHDTTAIGTGSDSDGVLYSTTARTAVAIKLIARIRITTGAVAGEWDNAATRVEPWMPGMKKTGDLMQVVEATPYTTYSNTATAIPVDNSIPQNTEGAEIMTAAIIPKSSINRLVHEFSGFFSGSGNIDASVALFQDSTADALAATVNTIGNLDHKETIALRHEMAAGTVSSTTFKIRCGPVSGTLYINGNSTTRLLGGIAACRYRITEIQA